MGTTTAVVQMLQLYSISADCVVTSFPLVTSVYTTEYTLYTDPPSYCCSSRTIEAAWATSAIVATAAAAAAGTATAGAGAGTFICLYRTYIQQYTYYVRSESIFSNCIQQMRRTLACDGL